MVVLDFMVVVLHLSGFSDAYYAASQGGSGGGGAWEQGTGASSNQGTFSGWTSYGNSGGNRYPSGETYATGGGGGAGGNGANSADGKLEVLVV